MNKGVFVIGILLIAGFAAMGVFEMMKSETPYVTSVSEVAAAQGRPLQFIGAIVPKATSYANDYLLFKLRDDKGKTLNVRYKGVKPANFDTAPKAVVRGIYGSSVFTADQVLLKCPSKYEGQ